MKNNNTNMKIKHELAIAIVEASLDLEQFFYENYPQVYIEHNEERRIAQARGDKGPPPLTFGSPVFKEKIVKGLTHHTIKWYEWFYRTRNAILHFGNDENNILENQDTRASISPGYIYDSLSLLITHLSSDLGKELSSHQKLLHCGNVGKLPPKRQRQTMKGSASANGKLVKAKNKALNHLDDDESMDPTNCSQETDLVDKTEESIGKIPAEQKIINMKPPFVVHDLAHKLGLIPFQIIKDLFEMRVFAKIDSQLEPKIAAQVCQKHGFTLNII